MKAREKRPHGKVPLTLLSGLLALAAVACDGPTEEAVSVAATTEAEAGPVDLATYCATICERTSRCGLELAKREAGSVDAALVSELEKGREAEAKRCVEECSATPIDPEHRFQMERAEVCLGKTDCGELSACMAAL